MDIKDIHEGAIYKAKHPSMNKHIIVRVTRIVHPANGRRTSFFADNLQTGRLVHYKSALKFIRGLTEAEITDLRAKGEIFK